MSPENWAYDGSKPRLNRRTNMNKRHRKRSTSTRQKWPCIKIRRRPVLPRLKLPKLHWLLTIIHRTHWVHMLIFSRCSLSKISMLLISTRIMWNLTWSLMARWSMKMSIDSMSRPDTCAIYTSTYFFVCLFVCVSLFFFHSDCCSGTYANKLILIERKRREQTNAPENRWASMYFVSLLVSFSRSRWTCCCWWWDFLHHRWKRSIDDVRSRIQ